MANVVPIQNMQPHARILIRNAVKVILIDNTDLGGRWFCSRPKPIFLNEMPCGLIYFRDEPVEHQGSIPRNYLRTLNLITEVVHRMESVRENALDDFLDSRAFEIEAAMMYDRYLGLSGIVEDCVFVNTEAINLESDGDQDIFALRLNWEIKYRTAAFKEGTIDEFLRFTTDYNTVDGATAQDNVTIRTS